MGNIHERLQGLREARDLESSTLKEEREELEKQKREKYTAEILIAQREQFAKLVVLQKNGVLSMIADATCTAEIEPEWPLSKEELQERQRQREERWKTRLQATTVSPRKREQQEVLEIDIRSLMRINSSEKGDHWIVGLNHPEITDELEWDTAVRIEAKKMTERRSIHGSSNYEEADRVTIVYDGETLVIRGKETEYEGFMPNSENMENAFVQAFDNPEDLPRQPNPRDHTHPQPVRY